MERDVGIGELVELLAVSTMTLATTRYDGTPHATPVYFAAGTSVAGVAEGSSPFPDPVTLEPGTLGLYFFSDPLSQHGQDLSANPVAAAALYPTCFDWQDIRGLQFFGRAAKVAGKEQWERGWVLYQHKFPFVASLKEIVARNTMYVFIPSWIRMVDNRRGFGFQQEWGLR